MAGVRMTVVWCPDWPVVAWGVPPDEPAVVVSANRVAATNRAARAEGVAVGQRRREAQGRCPDVAVLDRDADREARLFEPVAMALEELTPRIEVTGPGLVGFPTRGPSRFFGGDESMAHEVLQRVRPLLTGRLSAARGDARVGVADGIFAARLSARSAGSDGDRPAIVEPGDSAAFLAPLPVDTLDVALASPPANRGHGLTDVLRRLGLHTLGAFAALDAGDVVGRFGSEGRLAHRLARGEDEHPPDLRRPAPDLAVTWPFDPPAERVESCAFVAKTLADELHDTLATDGLACTRVAIEVETEQGHVQSRLWRHEGALSAAAIAERTRWQLDAWLTRNRGGGDDDADGHRRGSGVVRLTLVPDEVVPATGRQLGFWGGRNERADDVTRVVARLQAMLGPEAITVPELQGGIGPGERIRLVPAAAVDVGEERPATAVGWVDEPWPGRIPAPSPAHVCVDQPMVELHDDQGLPVGVDGRGEITAPPALVRTPPIDGVLTTGTSAVTGWAGPWPADQRWWDPSGHRRRARLQVVTTEGIALLLTLECGRWTVEAVYH
ncbi:MAG: DNA polymerase Y family protein [Actinomycetota bacterium]